MGKPIIQHQAVGTILAEMAIAVEASRALVWKSAWIKDSGGRNTYYSSMAKALASKAAVDNANSAVQVSRASGEEPEDLSSPGLFSSEARKDCEAILTVQISSSFTDLRRSRI